MFVNGFLEGTCKDVVKEFQAEKPGHGKDLNLQSTTGAHCHPRPL